MPTALPRPAPARAYALLLLLLLPLGAAAEPAGDTLRPAWESLATFFPDRARHDFAKAGGATTTGPREARFGYAAALLVAPPMTPARRAEAIGVLTDLARGDDEPGLASRYLLARATHLFAEPADPERAADLYADLVATHPASRWGQLALVRRASLLLFVTREPEEPAARIAAVEALLPLAADAATRRNLHVLLGKAHFALGVPHAGALPHLVAAVEIGGLDHATRADSLAQIAQLLRDAGRHAEAIPYLELFVRDHRRDGRGWMKEQELAALRREFGEAAP